MGTPLEIKPDDRVRLQRDLAERLMKHCACKRYKSKRKIDWLHRHGTVLSISPVTDSVYIRWDGRVSPDVWPFRAVEKLEWAKRVIRTASAAGSHAGHTAISRTLLSWNNDVAIANFLLHRLAAGV
jgi:hypothetical protein